MAGVCVSELRRFFAPHGLGSGTDGGIGECGLRGKRDEVVEGSLRGQRMLQYIAPRLRLDGVRVWLAVALTSA